MYVNIQIGVSTQLYKYKKTGMTNWKKFLLVFYFQIECEINIKPNYLVSENSVNYICETIRSEKPLIYVHWSICNESSFTWTVIWLDFDVGSGEF